MLEPINICRKKKKKKNSHLCHFLLLKKRQIPPKELSDIEMYTMVRETQRLHPTFHKVKTRHDGNIIIIIIIIKMPRCSTKANIHTLECRAEIFLLSE